MYICSTHVFIETKAHIYNMEKVSATSTHILCVSPLVWSCMAVSLIFDTHAQSKEADLTAADGLGGRWLQPGSRLILMPASVTRHMPTLTRVHKHRANWIPLSHHNVSYYTPIANLNAFSLRVCMCY